MTRRVEARPPIDWDEALRLHDDEGWTFAQIAREFQYAYNSVRMTLTARGARGRRPARKGEPARKLRAIWRFIRESCQKPTHPSYRNNGALGVRVCAEWESFETFYSWARANRYRAGLRLERLPGSTEYAPAMCRWVTAAERVARRRPSGPRQRPVKTPVRIDWDKAARLHLVEGISRVEIARRLGGSYSAIVLGLNARGARLPKRPGITATGEGRRLYKTWSSLHGRCERPGHAQYSYYGARGIRVAKEWEQFEPFLRWAQTSGAKPGLWLTRKDPKKNYSSKNCVWVTPDVVTRTKSIPANKPAPRRLVLAFGELRGVMEWSRDQRCRVSSTSISARLDGGWHPERAIMEPAQNRGGAEVVRRTLTAFKQTMGVTEWARDRRCKVTLTGLQDRLRRGWTPEDAIRTPPYKSSGQR